VDLLTSHEGIDDPAISGNGRCVAFDTYADGLDPSVTGTDVDFVYLKTVTGECPNDPPDTSITGAPPAQTSSRDATITSSSNDHTATFQCALDGAAFAACGASYSVHGLADGSHTAKVRAVDPAGNVDATPAATTWSVDATPPAVTVAIPKQHLKRVLARGLLLRLGSSELGTASVVVKRGKRVVGSKRTDLATAKTTVTVKLRFSKQALKALRRARSLRLVLTVVGQDALGNARTLRRTLTLRR
jgi:hypothetical protein